MSNMPINRRQQQRFNTDAPVIVVAQESASGHIVTTQIHGRTINVSASGALLELDEPVEAKRVWLRLVYGGDESLSECHVVRAVGENRYGVHFACLWSADTLRQLYKHSTELPTQDSMNHGQVRA